MEMAEKFRRRHLFRKHRSQFKALLRNKPGVPDSRRTAHQAFRSVTSWRVLSRRVPSRRGRVPSTSGRSVDLQCAMALANEYGAADGSGFQGGAFRKGALQQDTLQEGALQEGSLQEGTLLEGPLLEDALLEGILQEGALQEGPSRRVPSKRMPSRRLPSRRLPSRRLPSRRALS